MGGRGASLGDYYLHGKHMKYGDEYESVLEVDNIKFLKQKDKGSITAPRETMTKGRIYATLDKSDNLKYITYFDDKNKRYKQIDLDHYHNGMKPHVHIGYNHAEGGTRKINDSEEKLIDKIRNAWKNKNNK